MKKHLIIIFCIVTSICNAQVGGLPQNTDTITCQRVGFHYSDFYTRCNTYSTPTPFNTRKINFERATIETRPDILTASEHYTPHPIAVRGLAAMVVIDTAEILYRRNVILDGTTHQPVGNNLELKKRPEALLLYQVTDTATYKVRLVDSIRWDTAAPRWLKLPLSAKAMLQNDTSRMVQCCLFEAYFPEPVVVDSFFYVAGTSRSNIGNQPLGYEYTVPTTYALLKESLIDNYCFSCLSSYRILFNRNPVNSMWATEIYDTIEYSGGVSYNIAASSENNFYNSILGGYTIATGPFFAILDSDYYQLTVLTADDSMGNVYGSGHYTSVSNPRIGATPIHGYRFAQWTDGNFDNPRTVTIHSDTTFTAQFTVENNCYVHVAANREDWGSTTGKGFHPKNEPLTITATATGDSTWFVSWNDGTTDNPRVVVPLDDTAYIAIFASAQGIDDIDDIAFGLTPNPAHGSVTISTGIEGNYHVVLFDDAGRCVHRQSFSGTSTTIDIKNLPAGHYVTVTSDGKKTGVKTFIKQ